MNFKEIFVAISVPKKIPNSIRYKVSDGGKVKLKPSVGYNNLPANDQDELDDFMKRLEKNLTRWKGSSFNDETGAMEN